MTEGGDQGRQPGGWGQPGDQYGDQYQERSTPPATPPAPWTDHTGHQSGQQPAPPQQGWGQQPQGQDQPGQQSYGQQPYGQQQQPYGQDQPGQQSYGQQPPYGAAPAYNEQQAYGSPWGAPPPGYGAARTDYASWGSRAGALILDGIFAFLLFLPATIAFIAAFADADTTTNVDGTTEVSNVNGSLIGLAVLLALAALAVVLWNQGWRQGKKGQSWGKQIVGITLVREATGQPPGGGLGIGRLLLRQVLGAIPFFPLVDYLWPLWDEKNQTLVDKIVSTLVIRAR